MKKFMAFLLVITALILCACGQTEDKKKLDSNSSQETTESTENTQDTDGDKINAEIFFATENEDVKILLTNDTIASVQKTEVDQDVIAIFNALGMEESAKLTRNYQYEGIFLQDHGVYTLLLTKCSVSADLECADKDAVVTAMLLALEAEGVEDTVYAAYQKLFAGETCDAAQLGEFEGESWTLALENGKLTDVQILDDALALNAVYEFYGNNNVKSYTKYDTEEGTYVVWEYNENGEITQLTSHNANGVAVEKAEYTYFEGGELQSVKRYVGVKLAYECQYDVEGKILFEKEYKVTGDGTSDDSDDSAGSDDSDKGDGSEGEEE